ncbi:hypothetical protein EQV97_11305 [Pseudomonas sp. TMW22090]|nr:hypothetical protein [Pseudomonas sp. TMW22090]
MDRACAATGSGNIPVFGSSIQVYRRRDAGGTFVQVRRNPIIRNVAECAARSRRIRTLGQELSCLNLEPASPHSWVSRLP